MLEQQNENKIEAKPENEFENLQTNINKIIDVVEKIPEKYREKAFEILLNNSISREKIENKKDKLKKEESTLDDYSFQMPIEVRAFLSQFSISEERINELYLITGPKEIARKFRLNTIKAAEAQIQMAVLLALENTLMGDGKFEFNIENVRTKCEEEKCYDSKNFATNFKKKKKFFKDLNAKENIALSPLGKEHLADVLNEL